MAYPQPIHSRSANTSNRKTGRKPAGLFKLLPALALAGATLGLATSPVQALTQFAGTYAPANWTRSIGGDGSIDTSGAPASITLIGANDGSLFSPIARNTDFTIAAPSPGTVSFDWNYTSSDDSGNARFDPFGYLLNGGFTQLTPNDTVSIQSGSVSVSLIAGDVFGFRQASSDSILGRASTTISNFNAPNAPVVPSPLPLLGAGAALGWSRRLRYRLRAGLPASLQA
jgi:hypothetical protein